MVVKLYESSQHWPRLLQNMSPDSKVAAQCLKSNKDAQTILSAAFSELLYDQLRVPGCSFQLLWMKLPIGALSNYCAFTVIYQDLETIHQTNLFDLG